MHAVLCLVNFFSVAAFENDEVSLLQKAATRYDDNGTATSRADEVEGRVIGHWDYDDVDAWTEVSEDCAGTHQSPIDLPAAIGAAGVKIPYNYGVKYDLNLKNNGHALQIDGNFGKVTLQDGSYEALQFHFHFPSEHTVNGNHFAGEMHIVHQKEGSSGTSDLLVIGILLEQGNPTDDVLRFWKRAGLNARATLPEESETPEVSKINLNWLGPQLDGGFYRYDGSLTTPPCSETVKWFVMAEPALVQQQTVTNFKSLFPDPMNNRPTQELNDRFVTQNAL